MGKKTPKSVKKFTKKHLKASIDRRRKLKPMNTALRKQMQADKSDEKKGKNFRGTSQAEGKAHKKNVEEMNLDEFLQGDFSDGDIGAVSEDDSGAESDDSLPLEDEQKDFIDITLSGMGSEDESEEESDGSGEGLHSQNKSFHSEIQKHKKQLEKLKEKDPEFFQFLKEHDEELLEFGDEDEEAEQDDGDDDKGGTIRSSDNIQQSNKSSLSTSLVDTWCQAVKDTQHIGALKNLLSAYRTACHYGDGQEDDLGSKYDISSSHVFNRIMVFTLCEMDGVFRKLLGVDGKEGKSKREITMMDLEKHPRWKKLAPFMKSYLGNTLHILNQMTDSQMISFTVRRLKASVVFLGMFPKLSHKCLKAVLHFWGTGEGALSFISFIFVREVAIYLGTDYLEKCLKGIYKEYAANSKFVNATSTPHINFMAGCVVELYGIDLAASYQQAFVFIRQLAIILRNALTMKTKESYKAVYSWQYINCLEVWVRVLCTYSGKEDLKPLVYPIAQIVGGVARLVPTARYFPLRYQCAKMLNKLAAATEIFIPVSALLLDMLHFKELNMVASGGVGKATDFGSILKVPKPLLKTRNFHEECVSGVTEQIAEHLAHWSYAISFPELALLPLLGLRRFLKETKIDRFRRQVRQLVDQIELSIGYVGKRRDTVNFSPKDISAVSSFLQEEKKAGASPLSKYVITLRQKTEHHRASLRASSMIMGTSENGDADEDENEIDEKTIAKEGEKAFSSDWRPSKKLVKVVEKNVEDGKKDNARNNSSEDVLEDLEISSDDEGDEEDEEFSPPTVRKRGPFDEDQATRKKKKGTPKLVKSKHSSPHKRHGGKQKRHHNNHVKQNGFGKKPNSV